VIEARSSCAVAMPYLILLVLISLVALAAGCVLL